MRPLIRSMFLLSLAAAPLAIAATPAPAPISPSEVATAAISDSGSVASTSRDGDFADSQLEDIEATLDGIRREVSDLQAQADARPGFIGDQNDHPLRP